MKESDRCFHEEASAYFGRSIPIVFLKLPVRWKYKQLTFIAPFCSECHADLFASGLAKGGAFFEQFAAALQWFLNESFTGDLKRPTWGAIVIEYPGQAATDTLQEPMGLRRKTYSGPCSEPFLCSGVLWAGDCDDYHLAMVCPSSGRLPQTLLNFVKKCPVIFCEAYGAINARLADAFGPNHFDPLGRGCKEVASVPIISPIWITRKLLLGLLVFLLQVTEVAAQLTGNVLRLRVGERQSGLHLSSCSLHCCFAHDVGILA